MTKTKQTRLPDVFIGQTSADGIVDTLTRQEQDGFVFYLRSHTFLTLTIPAKEEGEEPKKWRPNGIKMARKARRRYMDELKEKGLTVHGKQHIDFELIQRLNMNRFEYGDRLQDMDDVRRVLDNNGYILMGLFGEYSARVHNAESFGKVRLGEIWFQQKEQKIFEVKPKADAEAI